MPRFVLLYHDCPPNYSRPSHWDFMLEFAGVLRTWALDRLPYDWHASRTRTASDYPNCPSLSPHNRVGAIQLNDHRLDYLALEGPLSGNRGTVTQVAAGTYRSEHEAPGDWRVVLTSDDLAARVQLSRSEADHELWVVLSMKY